MLLVEAHRQVIRDLAACRDNHAVRIFQLEDIHHTLEGQFVEVKAVTHIIVGRNRFGVVVDHHRTPALLTDRFQRLHAAPIELDRAADPVSAGTQHDDGAMVAQILHIVFRTAIGQVQVVRLRRIFGGQRIDLLHDRDDTVLFTELAYLHHTFFYIPFKAEGTGDLEIGETLHFRLANEFRIQTPTLDAFHIEGAQFLIGLHDSVEFLQEPFVDLRQFMYLVDGISGAECFRDNEDAGIGRFMERLVDVGDHQFLVFHEAVHTLPDHTKPLLDRLFEGTADGHHFAHRFHA